MSQSAATVARRQIRRTVGAEAVAIIEAHSAILNSTVLPSLNAQASAIESEGVRITEAWRMLREHEGRLDRWHARSFWQRLRWLVTGR